MKLYEKYLRMDESSTSSLINKLKKLKWASKTKDNHPMWKPYKNDKTMKYIDGAYNQKDKSYWMVYDDGEMMISWGDTYEDNNDPFDGDTIEEILNEYL